MDNLAVKVCVRYIMSKQHSFIIFFSNIYAFVSKIRILMVVECYLIDVSCHQSPSVFNQKTDEKNEDSNLVFSYRVFLLLYIYAFVLLVQAFRQRVVN